MANMSYCRFENTLNDLQDCIYTLQGRNGDISSESEKRKAKALINLMVDFLSSDCIIDEVPEDVEERIEEMVDNCNGEEEED